MRTLLVPLLLAGITCCSTVTAKAEISVDINFPGGSGQVVSIDQQARAIVINPSEHAGHGWRCWWFVKLSGLEKGKTVSLDVGDAPWATPNRATFSIDGGKTWKHSREGTRDGKRIRYPLSFDTDTALVAWGPPFVSADARSLVAEIARETTDATAFNLCTTREGRETPALRIGSVGKPLIWIQARQHAWESGASWVGRGFVEWLVSEVAEAEALRDDHEIVFVPIMDIDNVHRGAGGKNQTPQDHNRDWSDAPHWHAVAAAQKELRAAAEADRLAMFLDLHNPGANDLFPYFYVPPADVLSHPAQENLANFLAAAKAEITGPLRFAGRVTESGSRYDAKAWTKISKNWVARLGTPAVSATLETAWNTPASTTDGYLTVGRQLGLAIHHYRKHGGD